MFAEKLMVALRDGRKLIGVLRSWDQFGMGNSVLTFSLRSLCKGEGGGESWTPDGGVTFDEGTFNGR